MNKQDWTYKKLGEVCDFQGGSQPPKEEWIDEYKEGYIRMLQIRDFTQSRAFTKEYIKITNRIKTCKKDDILIGRYGASVGKILTGEEGAYNVAIMKTIPDESIISKDYAKLFFQSPSFQHFLQSVCNSRAAQAGFSKSDISDYLIPIPSLGEQERIVAELDLLQGIIEKKKEQLKAYDQLAQSIFYTMFGDPIDNPKGWETKKLKDITTKIGSGATPKGGNQSYKNEGISLIRSLNVHNGSFKYEDLAHIDEQQAHQLNNVIVEENDVLFNITGASVARCCIVPFDVLPARVNQHVSILRPKKEIVNHVYLCYYLISPNSQNALLVMSKSNAATREALPKSMMEKYSICIPPLSLQKEFAEKIEAIERQKALVQQSIEEVQTMFDCTMDKYFG